MFFAPGYTAPLTVAAPLVLTIHDVSFFAHPEWFSFREGLRRRLAHGLVRPPRAHRHHRYRILAGAKIARHIGVHERARDSARDRSAGRAFDTVVRTSVLRSSCTLVRCFERRRVDRLIAAFDSGRRSRAGRAARDRRREPHAARASTSRRFAPAAGTRDRISIRSYVDDAALASLYGARRCLRSSPNTKASG